MTCSRNVWLFLVAAVQVLRSPLGTSAAESPCPDVFQYAGSPGSEYGIITVPNPYPYRAIDTSVSIYVSASESSNSSAKLEPVINDMRRKLAAGSRDPFFYRIDFPVSSPLPTIKTININNNIICTGSKPNSAYVSTVTLQHTIYDERCNSARLDCPFNIQQSAEIRPHTTNKVFSPAINTLVLQRGLFDKKCSAGSPDCNDNSKPSDQPIRLERAAFNPEPEEEYPSPKPSLSTSTPGGDNYTKCGIPAVNTSRLRRVVNGRDSVRGEWPWHAAVYLYQGFDTVYRCGGTLVGTRTIITAANCVTYGNGKARAPEDFVVALGRYDLSIRKEEGTQEKDVQRIIPHPAYNHRNFDADIALLILNSSVEYTRFVRPVCLWNPSDKSLESVVGKEGVVVGWRWDGYGLYAETLKMVITPVVSRDACKKQNEEYYVRYVHTNAFCAGLANGSAPCNGDSGGGLVIPVFEEGDSMFYGLRGVVSNGRTVDNIRRTCDPNSYTIFTDVTQYLSWISVNII